MYRIAKEIITYEDSEEETFGISDDKGLLITFTEDPDDAQRSVRLCNENEVEENHIADLIEDLFYS